MEWWQVASAPLTRMPANLLIAVFAVAAGALILSIALAFKVRSLTRASRRMAGGSKNPEEIVPALTRAVEKNRESIDNLMVDVRQILYESRSFLKYVSLVRYDAFEDVGGQQSYSLCLLDSNRNGILITYLTGRNSTRGYAVRISAGDPSRKLSDEESKALDEALKQEAAA